MMTTHPPTDLAAGEDARTPGASPPPLLDSRRTVPVWPFVLLATGAVVGAVLFFFNPTEHAFYPRCSLYAMTGWLCPGCGGLRATHQLLHGHFAAAWALNPLVVLLVPVAAWFGMDGLLVTWHGRGLPKPRWNVWLVLLGVLGLILFGVLRNISFP